MNQQKPALIVIFGITGDLSKRKLLPALYRLFCDGLLHKDTRIIGVTRQKLTKDDVLSGMGKAEDNRTYRQFARAFMLRPMDLADRHSYLDLKKYLDQIEADKNIHYQRLYYLSIPPSVFDEVVGFMGKAGLQKASSSQINPALLVEKPFGYDYASAKDLIRSTKEYFKESQIYRIDHYLAKEMAQNILDFRFHNPIFNAIWNHNHISRIVITAHEKIGIEGRVAFYEQTGALRDLIQSHLLQLMSLIAMEKPRSIYDGSSVHKKRLQLLEDIIIPQEYQVPDIAVRGQYKTYSKEVNNPDSSTETYAALKLFIDNERWQGVPFVLRTGKAVGEKLTSIDVYFGNNESNRLEFRMQPDEGIKLSLRVKQPGHSREQFETRLDLNYQRDFPSYRLPEAYERVLLDAINQDQTLFASSEEVLASWRIVEPVLGEWAKTDNDLQNYENGTKLVVFGME